MTNVRFTLCDSEQPMQDRQFVHEQSIVRLRRFVHNLALNAKCLQLPNLA
jgi:hypothetical protein